MDIVGRIPIYVHMRNIYKLTTSDLLTIYLIAMVLRKTTSEEIADAFTKGIVCKFGSPKEIKALTFYLD